MIARAHERGFTLVEAIVATALASGLTLAILEAAVGSMHAATRVRTQAQLAGRALDILSDLRESTAYDRVALANLAGKTVTARLPPDAPNGTAPLTATVSVAAPSGPGAVLVASVTVSDAAGDSVTERRPLFVEAPIPGSTIDAPSPGPASP